MTVHNARADGHRRTRWLELAHHWRFAGIFLIAFSEVLRFIDIDKTPHVDEFSHSVANGNGT